MGSKSRGYDELVKDGEILHVISVNGIQYAGADAHKYPDCEKSLLDIEAFCVGISWEWYDER